MSYSSAQFSGLSALFKIDLKLKYTNKIVDSYFDEKVYNIINNSLVDYYSTPKFLISVRLKDTKLYEGSGDSKKKAEQNAAKKLLDNIK